jgi:hypothetical protein
MTKLGKALKFYLHLDVEKVMKIMVGKDMKRASQLTLCIHIHLTELCLVGRNPGLLPRIPYHLAPMVVSRVPP